MRGEKTNQTRLSHGGTAGGGLHVGHWGRIRLNSEGFLRRWQRAGAVGDGLVDLTVRFVPELAQSLNYDCCW